METFLIILSLALFIFSIWYIYKQLEYWSVSERLFRKMRRRQDDMIKLLLDIRDNTKTFQPEVPEVINCPRCTTKLKLSHSERQIGDIICPKCKNKILIIEGGIK